MAKLAIDARESGTSTGRYIDKLVENLHKLRPDIDVVVMAKPARLDYFKSVAPRFTVVEADYKEFTFAEQLGFNKALKSLRPDLVHFGKDHQPVLYKGGVVTTMHDLTTTRFKNPDKNPLIFRIKQAVYRRMVKKVARKSAAILAPSQFVKNDIVQYTKIDPAKVTVTYEAAEPIKDVPEPVEGLEERPFLMYVGRPTPHKNLERLIDAFASIKPRHPDMQLVLAGKQDKNYQRIEKIVQAKGIGNILFTGFVTEGQLRWLYQNCAAYIFPSMSEGFGLPGLEAMIHGAPVISSNATCLPEIYGQAAHYFDPLDTQSMTDAIDEVLTDKALRQKLIENGKQQARKYSWQRMAEQTLAVYKQVLNQK